MIDLWSFENIMTFKTIIIIQSSQEFFFFFCSVHIHYWENKIHIQNGIIHCFFININVFICNLSFLADIIIFSNDIITPTIFNMWKKWKFFSDQKKKKQQQPVVIISLIIIIIVQIFFSLSFSVTDIII